MPSPGSQTEVDRASRRERADVVAHDDGDRGSRSVGGGDVQPVVVHGDGEHVVAVAEYEGQAG